MAKDIATLRRHKESMGIYTPREQRAKDIEALMRAHGPMGCKQLAGKLDCCRATIQQIVRPRIGTMFKLVQQATDGPYGREALYDVKDSDTPEATRDPVPPALSAVTQDALYQIMYGVCREHSTVGET